MSVPRDFAWMRPGVKVKLRYGLKGRISGVTDATNAVYTIVATPYLWHPPGLHTQSLWMVALNTKHFDGGTVTVERACWRFLPVEPLPLPPLPGNFTEWSRQWSKRIHGA